MKASRKYTININPFQAMDNTTAIDKISLSVAKNCYNFVVKNGSIQTGLGISSLLIVDYGYNDEAALTYRSLPPIGKAITKMFVYKRYDTIAKKRDDRLLAYVSSEKVMYECSLIDRVPVWTIVSGLTLVNDNISVVNYTFNKQDLILVGSEGSVLRIYDGNAVTMVNDAPNSTSMIEHYGRIFISKFGDEAEIWFSSSLDPYNWDVSSEGGGYIRFNDEYGKVLKLVSYGEFIYIFRERAIFRLLAYGDQQDFSLNIVYQGLSNIKKESILICSNHIMFCTDFNLYKFNGHSVTELLNKVDIFSTFDLAYSDFATLGNKYYLTMRHDYEDDDFVGCETASKVFVNTLLVFDTDENNLSMMRGISPIMLCPITINQNNVMAIMLRNNLDEQIGMIEEGRNTVYFDEIKSAFVSYKLDLGSPNAYKRIRCVHIHGEGNFLLELYADNNKERHFVKAKRGNSIEIKSNLRGKTIGYKIEGSSFKLVIDQFDMEIER